MQSPASRQMERALRSISAIRRTTSGSGNFYVDRENRLSATTIDVTAGFRAGTPTTILEPRYYAAPQTNVRAFDVAPDGRFLMIKIPDSRDAVRAQVVVVLNWFEELKRLVPTN
jgi:hypothetical protein